MFLTRVVDFVSPYSVRAKLRLWYRHFHGQTEKRNDKKRLVTLVRIRVNIQSGYLLKTSHKILCLCFRASLIYINNCPTRCNTKLSIYYSASSLYMFRVSTTPIIRSTQNCNCSLRYWSFFVQLRSSKGTAVAQLRCCATNRKVVGSIPAGVIGIFH